MKKLGLLLLALSLCGCSTIEKNETVKKYAVFISPLSEHLVWLKAKEGFLDACEAMNYNCDWVGPTSIDVQEMERLFEIAIMQKVDTIITQGVISKELINKAVSQGIKVALVDADVEGSECQLVYIKDFREQADLFVEDIIAKKGNKQKINIAIQVAELGFDIAKNQISELEKSLRRHDVQYNLIQTTESKSDALKSKREWDYIFDNYHIDVAINFAGEAALPCYNAALEAGQEKDILIYAVDDMGSTMELVKQQKIEGSVVVSFYDYGYNGMMNHSYNKTSPRMVFVDTQSIDHYLEEISQR